MSPPQPLTFLPQPRSLCGTCHGSYQVGTTTAQRWQCANVDLGYWRSPAGVPAVLGTQSSPAPTHHPNPEHCFRVTPSTGQTPSLTTQGTTCILGRSWGGAWSHPHPELCSPNPPERRHGVSAELSGPGANGQYRRGHRELLSLEGAFREAETGEKKSDGTQYRSTFEPTRQWCGEGQGRSPRQEPEL